MFEMLVTWSKNSEICHQNFLAKDLSSKKLRNSNWIHSRDFFDFFKRSQVLKSWNVKWNVKRNTIERNFIFDISSIEIFKIFKNLCLLYNGKCFNIITKISFSKTNTKNLINSCVCCTNENDKNDQLPIFGKS